MQLGPGTVISKIRENLQITLDTLKTKIKPEEAKTRPFVFELIGQNILGMVDACEKLIKLDPQSAQLAVEKNKATEYAQQFYRNRCAAYRKFQKLVGTELADPLNQTLRDDLKQVSDLVDNAIQDASDKVEWISLRDSEMRREDFNSYWIDTGDFSFRLGKKIVSPPVLEPSLKADLDLLRQEILLDILPRLQACSFINSIKIECASKVQPGASIPVNIKIEQDEGRQDESLAERIQEYIFHRISEFTASRMSAQETYIFDLTWSINPSLLTKFQSPNGKGMLEIKYKIDPLPIPLSTSPKERYKLQNKFEQSFDRVTDRLKIEIKSKILKILKNLYFEIFKASGILPRYFNLSMCTDENSKVEFKIGFLEEDREAYQRAETTIRDLFRKAGDDAQQLLDKFGNGRRAQLAKLPGLTYIFNSQPPNAMIDGDMTFKLN